VEKVKWWGKSLPAFLVTLTALQTQLAARRDGLILE
jgi:hypothetical protein